MSTFAKTFLKISLASLVFGAILLGAGYATGGIQAIQKITAPIKQTETFIDISDIQLDAYRPIRIQTGNVDTTSVSYYSGSKFLGNLHLEKKGASLSIRTEGPKNLVVGGIEVVGHLLNEGQVSNGYNEIVITVPKDKPLSSVSGSGLEGLSVNNITLKKLDYHSDVAILNTKIESGKVLGAIFVYESELKDMTLENYYSLSDISDSKLENVTIIDRSSNLSIQNSILKNIHYSSGQSLEEMEPAAENSDSDYTNGYGDTYFSISLKNVEFFGDNTFMASAMDIEVDMAEDSKSKTSLNVETMSDNVHLDGHFKTLETIRANQLYKVSYKAKDAKGQLIIKNNYGNISIK